MYYILNPLTFSPFKLKFVPEFLGVRESREMRLKEFYAHVGYLGWAPNVAGEKMQITFPPTRDGTWFTGRPALYNIAIKTGLYRMAV